MKKLLSILGAAGLVTTVSAPVVACDTISDIRNFDWWKNYYNENKDKNLEELYELFTKMTEEWMPKMVVITEKVEKFSKEKQDKILKILNELGESVEKKDIDKLCKALVDNAKYLIKTVFDKNKEDYELAGKWYILGLIYEEPPEQEQ